MSFLQSLIKQYRLAPNPGDDEIDFAEAKRRGELGEVTGRILGLPFPVRGSNSGEKGRQLTGKNC